MTSITEAEWLESGITKEAEELRDKVTEWLESAPEEIKRWLVDVDLDSQALKTLHTVESLRARHEFDKTAIELMWKDRFMLNTVWNVLNTWR